MAVSHVEAPKGGFYDDGFPAILFERHKFYKHARRDKRNEWYSLYPTICNPTATPRGGYGSVDKQRVKFSQAFALDPDAAMMACSWGAFQELGENYDDYGFHSVGEFVDKMKSGIEGQLEIFIRSIRHRGLVDELQRKDAAGFARLYNGANYRRFEYDDQIKNAYTIFKAKNIDWDRVMSEPELTELSPAEVNQLTENLGTNSTAVDPAGSNATLPNSAAFNTVEEPVPGMAAVGDGPSAIPGPGDDLPPGETTISEKLESQDGKRTIEQSITTPAGDAPDAEPSSFLHLEDWKPFAFRWLKRIWASVTGITVPAGFGLGIKAVQDPPNWFIYVAIAVVIIVIVLILAFFASMVLLAIWYFNRKEIKDGKMLAAKTLVDPNSKNLGVKIWAQ